MREEKESHPWDDFLKCRYKAMLWLKERSYSDEEIAEQLSMDKQQVSAILSAMENNF